MRPLPVFIRACLAAAGILLKGAISMDYLLAGAVAGIVVAGVVAVLLRRKNAPAAEKVSPPVAIPRPRFELEPAPPPAAPDNAAPKAAEKSLSPTSGRTDIERAVNKLDSLPAMPFIAQKLLALKMDSEKGQQEMLMLVEQDPQISARILSLANAAAISASRQIRTVREAALMLGFKRVQLAAVSIALLSLMSDKSTGDFNMEGLWLHSYRVAAAMQALAQLMPPDQRPPSDEIFLAGMMHDFGYLALALINPQQSDKLHSHLSAAPERSSMEIEREIVDICHDELGAELASHWKLPENLIAVLRYHHAPDEDTRGAGQPLARMINIVEKLLSPYGIIEYVTPDIDAHEWTALGIDPAQAEAARALVEEQASQAAQFANTFT
jgi:HD-like signal output (HDOD) protein